MKHLQSECPEYGDPLEILQDFPVVRVMVKPDDLTLIEGIGPKIAQALVSAEITSFAKLAKMKPGKIRNILRDAGIRLGFPDTWPEQAALAAEGKWGELTAFQKTLSGGRR